MRKSADCRYTHVWVPYNHSYFDFPLGRMYNRRVQVKAISIY
jgi:hypothetical protein